MDDMDPGVANRGGQVLLLVPGAAFHGAPKGRAGYRKLPTTILGEAGWRGQSRGQLLTPLFLRVLINSQR
jgi:hypothetical protein